MKIFLCLKRLRSGGMENASELLHGYIADFLKGGRGVSRGEETPRGGNQYSFREHIPKKSRGKPLVRE